MHFFLLQSLLNEPFCETSPRYQIERGEQCHHRRDKSLRSIEHVIACMRMRMRWDNKFIGFLHFKTTASLLFRDQQSTDDASPWLIQIIDSMIHARAKKVHPSSSHMNAMSIVKSVFHRTMNRYCERIRSSSWCGKLVSFMWKNCRKDVALTFDFYTNSRSGCCSFEEIGLFGTRFVENTTRRQQAEDFDKGFLSTGC